MDQHPLTKAKAPTCQECGHKFQSFQILGSKLCRPCLNDREQSARAWRLMMEEYESRPGLINTQKH